MTNGNLRNFLDGASEKRLDWGTRVAIAIGAAKGLEYLHDAAAPRILHRDVKSTNILLDENWRAKVRICFLKSCTYWNLDRERLVIILFGKLGCC